MSLALFLIMIAMLLLIIRAILGETIFDRILAANSFGTLTIGLILILGFINKTEFYLDIAIIYALINFVTTIALLRYYKYKR